MCGSTFGHQMEHLQDEQLFQRGEMNSSMIPLATLRATNGDGQEVQGMGDTQWS